MKPTISNYSGQIDFNNKENRKILIGLSIDGIKLKSIEDYAKLPERYILWYDNGWVLKNENSLIKHFNLKENENTQRTQ